MAERSGVSAPEVRADVDRAARTGAPEVVFAGGKSAEQTVLAATSLRNAGVRPVLVTCADADHVAAIVASLPGASVHEDCGVVVLDGLEPRARPAGGAVIVAAGTSDLSVARECQVVLEAMGELPQLFVDVGVAGLHRILEVAPQLEDARVVIVVAGMEAALAPVVAGLVDAPIIAVPTSVGYGAAQDGMTALHGLLTACAPGIGVVNIDNGLGAALLACRILGSSSKGSR